MGLDTVEIVMELEDEFQLSIPDDVASNIATVGETFDFIVATLRNRCVTAPRGSFCLTARRFRELRKNLVVEFGMPHRAIRPSAMIGDLIPASQDRSRWSRFACEQGLPKPPFVIFPIRRFPNAMTSVGDLVRGACRGDYESGAGGVDTERVWLIIREIVSEQAGVAVEEITTATRYIDDLHLD
jgi:acyl carrier protein